MPHRDRAPSPDGTPIVYDQRGEGPPVILVGGSLTDRSTYRPLAEKLAGQLTVFTYDRRGRGDSGDTPPYAVEREIEDLAALVDRAGGRATVYGHSSGAALVLHAAAHGLGTDAIVLHEPPFGSGSGDEQRAEQAEAWKVSALLQQDRRADAIRFYLGSAGMPAELVDQLSREPSMLANAATLPHDPYVLMSAASRGGRTPAEQAGLVRTRALVLAGGSSPEWMIDAGRQIAGALPHGRFHVLDGQDHVVPPEVLAPVLTAFVIGDA